VGRVIKQMDKTQGENGRTAGKTHKQGGGVQRRPAHRKVGRNEG